MQKIIERVFDISHDASASLIISLLTFLLGYLITGAAFLISRYFVRKSTRKIFFDNLLSLNISLLRQQKAFTDTIRTLDIQQSSPWVYSRVDFFQIDVFKEMSYKDIFKSFFLGMENRFVLWSNKKIKKFKKLKRKAYNKTWANLSNVKFWSERAYQDFYPALDKLNQFGDKRNSALNELRQMWEQLYQRVQTQPSAFNEKQVEYLKALDEITGAYQNIPTIERVRPFKTHRSLILPIRILNKKYHTLEFVRVINDKAMEVSHHYQDMELLIRHTRFQYKTYYYSFRSIQKTNEMAMKILNSNA